MVCVEGGPPVRSHTLTRSGDLGEGNFSDKAKGLFGVAAWGFQGRPEKISKTLILKSMKMYNFRPIFDNFNENFVKMYRIFSENLGKISKYSLIRGSGGGAP